MRRRCLPGRLVLDVHEDRLLAREPDVDAPARKLGADLVRRLLEHLEEPEAERRRQRSGEAGGGLGDRVVADGGDRLEVCLQRLDVWRNLHRDIIMTSLWHLSNVI